MSTIQRLLGVMIALALCLTGAVLAEETAEITAHDFLGEWVDQDGTTNIDIEAHHEEGNYIVNVRLDAVDSDAYDYLVWAYGCVWDEEARSLKSVSRFAGTGDFETAEEEITDSDLEYADAQFIFDDAGMLVWDDANETADDGMLFQHTVGWVDPDYVGPGHHFVGEWDDERMFVVIEETMEDYQVVVTGSGGAFSGAYWAYTCDYDAETDSLVSNGEVAQRIDYAFSEDGEEYSEELVYEDGEAVFSLNEEGELVWNDKKENAGEGHSFTLVAEDEEGDWQETAGNVIAPVDPGYDLTALGDGEYPVYFAPADLTDGALTLTVYSEDVYDAVEVGQIAVGDTFWLGGLDFEVESVEFGDDVLINGGMDEGGFTLRSYDEDNCWRLVMEDEWSTYTDRGETTLPLSENVTFTDAWENEDNPATASGAAEVEAAIAGTEMDYFSPLNTTVRVEGGEIVEIVRAYM